MPLAVYLVPDIVQQSRDHSHQERIINVARTRSNNIRLHTTLHKQAQYTGSRGRHNLVMNLTMIIEV